MPYLRKLGIWFGNKRALSPIFATVLLATIIIVFGSVAYYYANNVTTTTTNNYVSSLSNSQQSIAERIGFENVVYTSTSSPAMLTVYIINSGSANNLKINSVFIYDVSHVIVGAYSGSSQISGLYPIGSATPSPTIIGNALNVGKEAVFYVTLNGPPLTHGSIYTIHIITQSGSAFDNEFTA